MARLTKIEIEGFRSIKQMSLELGPLNVLIGANGSGKSNFVSFFKMLNEMMFETLREYVGKTGWAQSLLHFGPKVTRKIEWVLEFDAGIGRYGYEVRLLPDQMDTLFIALEGVRFLEAGQAVPDMRWLGTGIPEARIRAEAKQGDPIAQGLFHLMNQCRVYHFHDTSATARVRLSCYMGDHRRLLPDAGNMPAMLYHYRHSQDVVYNRIVSAIRKIMPEFDDFDLEPDGRDQNYLFLNWRQRGSDYLFGPHQISDGSLRAMAILTLLLQPEEDLPDVIILDEPELGLHPQALGLVAGLMRAASLKSQLIVATQSQSLLDYFDPAEIITVESHEGQSTFRRLEPEELKDWLEDYTIGELWQRNVLGGGPLP